MDWSRAMSVRLVCAFLGISLAVAGHVGAAELDDAAGVYAIDGSSIRFSIGNAAGRSLSGGFRSFQGRIRIDGRDISRSRVDISIVPASVSTGQERVDRFLKSDAVFDAANERRITFTSSEIMRTGDSSATISGWMTARGRRFRETFQAELVELKGNRIRFHVTGRVLRSRYGMDVGTPIYSNVVNFDMQLTGRRS
jgi:polyisoprenoid-binding protein YceI